MAIFYRVNKIIQLIVILTLLSLAACNSIPRGAPLQKEVTGSILEADKKLKVQKVTSEFVKDFNKAKKPEPNLYSWPRYQEPSVVERLIQRGDHLSINIWDSADNSLLTSPGQRVVSISEIIVSQAGNIFLPYIGLVEVANLTTLEARRKLENSIKAISPTSQVQLVITKRRIETVEILSGVTVPGNYQMLDGSMSVMELLANSGGVISTFENPQLGLHRNGDKYNTSIQSLYDYPKKDVQLLAGDRLFVQEDPRYFLSLGASGKEDQHNFNRENISSLDAVAMTGGVADNRADLKGILILREYNRNILETLLPLELSEQTIFVIDLTTADGIFAARNFEILDRDVIFITESPITSVNTILSVFGRFLGIARNVQNLE